MYMVKVICGTGKLDSQELSPLLWLWLWLLLMLWLLLVAL
jgi:hypothetical protein